MGAFYIYTFTENMNTAQLTAIKAPPGNFLIHAGAGTGKTTTIAARILYLQLSMGINPSKIKGISFSNTAKNSLNEKVKEMIKLEGEGSEIEINTFHSFAFKIVLSAIKEGKHWRKHAPSIVSNAMDIFYAANKKKIDYEDCPKFYQAISFLKQGKNPNHKIYYSSKECCTKGDFLIKGINGEDIYLPFAQIKEYWANFDKRMKKLNLIDFPSLITEAIEILSKPESTVYQDLINSIDYLIIDEYQDTSVAQEVLILMLAKSKKLFLNVVGDSRQTIYSFNGSTIDNILLFKKKLEKLNVPVLETIDLEKNYRSEQRILDLANHIVNQSNLYQSNLTANKTTVVDDNVVLVHSGRYELAANFVFSEIKTLIENGVNPKEIAVLVRKNSEYSPHGTHIANLLETEGIPYQYAVKVAQSTIELYEKALEICAFHMDMSIEELITLVGHDTSLIPITAHRTNVIDILAELRNEQCENGYEAIVHLSEKLDYPEALIEDNNKVFLNTIHSAKGLEFPYVFVLFLGDRSFPHGKYPDIEEDRRLLHVAITRAMKRVYILGQPGVRNYSFWNECNQIESKQIEYLTEKEEVFIEANEKTTEEYRRIREQMVEDEQEEINFDEMWND
ncbi:ATP-dependent helicase [Neobacillus sp. NPDC093182]|uniref:ATP-dependent helicase n=1 Tax=Neobacillus sp. NPDC093182 TaxID=3364297 RepID=UPI003817728A